MLAKMLIELLKQCSVLAYQSVPLASPVTLSSNGTSFKLNVRQTTTQQDQVWLKCVAAVVLHRRY